MKTHIVIDTVYHEDEGNDVFVGTIDECHDWVHKQGFGYRIVPMTEAELRLHNEMSPNSKQDIEVLVLCMKCGKYEQMMDGLCNYCYAQEHRV